MSIVLVIIAIASFRGGFSQDLEVGGWNYEHFNDPKLDSGLRDAVKILDKSMINSEKSKVLEDHKKLQLVHQHKEFRKVMEDVMEENRNDGSRYDQQAVLRFIRKFEDIYWKLEEDDNSLKGDGISEIVAAFGDLIPPPTGTVISTLANVAATIYGSTTESTAQEVVRKVGTMIREQYRVEVKNAVKKEIGFLNVELRFIEKRSKESYKRMMKCQKKELQGCEAEPHECQVKCGLTRDNRHGLIVRYASPLYAKTDLITIRETITQQADQVGSFTALKRLHNLLKMYVILKSSRFALFQEIKNYLSIYVPEYTNPSLLAEAAFESEHFMFNNWIDLNFERTFSLKKATFALYLVSHPISGMEEAVENILQPMKELAETSQNTEIYWNIFFDDKGWVQPCSAWRDSNISGTNRASTGAKSTCRKIPIRFELYNSSNLAQGVRAVKANSDFQIIGIDDSEEGEGLLRVVNKTINPTRFVMVPMKYGRWIVLAMNRPDTDKAGLFSLIGCRQSPLYVGDTYLNAPTSNFNDYESLDDQSACLSWHTFGDFSL